MREMATLTKTSTSQKVQLIARRNQRFDNGTRLVAEEMPVALSYNGTTQAVMMATPGDLEDFAIGFSLTEGIIARASEIERMEIVAFDQGIDVQMWLTETRENALVARRRFMAGPVGCGLCGIDSIEQAVRPLRPLETDGTKFSADDIIMAMSLLAAGQHLNQKTHAVHAAGFYTAANGMLAVREDVGRHNALDKLIGAVARGYMQPQQGLVALTSRVSVEMVQRTVMSGVPVLAAISAPTSLAIRLAEESNLTLVAVVRGEEFDVFTHAHRIIMS